MNAAKRIKPPGMKPTITRPQYEALVEAFHAAPGEVSKAARKAGVSGYVARQAWAGGYAARLTWAPAIRDVVRAAQTGAAATRTTVLDELRRTYELRDIDADRTRKIEAMAIEVQRMGLASGLHAWKSIADALAKLAPAASAALLTFLAADGTMSLKAAQGVVGMIGDLARSGVMLADVTAKTLAAERLVTGLAPPTAPEEVSAEEAQSLLANVSNLADFVKRRAG